MTQREPCRAACGRWGAGATFAQQSGDSGAPGTRQSQGVNAPGRAWSDLSPLSPLLLGLSPLPTGTDFFNGDKGLGQLSTVVPAVPAKKSARPETDQAKTHAQTPRRPAALALVATVRPVNGGRGYPPSTGPSGAFGHTGNSHHVKTPASPFWNRLIRFSQPEP